MWHEARKREKATQKLFNEHRKRAEKRREEDKVNPNSLLKIHGLKSKLNLDPGIYKQALKSLVPWQGDKNITIDRFDVRATLSSIPSTSSTINKSDIKTSSVLDANESDIMKKVLNYERYRILIQNDLNKTPEEVRLKLVGKSDIESDAKMRKLRNNRFGTSGESSMPIINNYNSNDINASTHNRNSDSLRRNNSRSTTGPSYNSVPPPSSLVDAQQEGISHTDKRVNNGINAMNVIDLDLYDNLELDNVDHILKIFNDNKKINDVSKKYSLSSEEFSYLAKVDTKEVCVNDIMKQLSQILKERSEKADSKDDAKDIDRVYGPSLPPNLVNSGNNDDGVEEDSSSDESRIQQRSPSGAVIPLREDEVKSSDDDDLSTTNETPKLIELDQPTTANKEEVKEKPLPNRFLPIKINLGAKLPSNTNIKNDSSYDKSHEKRKIIVESKPDDKPAQRESRERTPKRYEPRRAVTPLAYKKYSRSERSISRERKSKRSR